MPLKFTCQKCRSTLSVSSHKAGQQVLCPRCRQRTRVPVPKEAAVAGEAAAKEAAGTRESSSRAEQAEEREPSKETLQRESTGEAPAEEKGAPAEEIAAPPAPPSSFNALAEMDSGPDEVTWVYESDQPALPVDSSASLIDFDKIALPRYVLYAQGGLLGGVAILALVLGILIGRASAPRVTVERTGPAQPCYITGTISYTSSSGTKRPDAGAVVLVVPQDRRPEEKAPIEGLRPGDPMPQPELPAVARIKAIGGDYTRTDEQGNYKLRVPDTGDYFILVVSKQLARKPSEKLDSVHLAQMGRYVLPAPDLIDDRKYAWLSETIKRDKTLNVTLE